VIIIARRSLLDLPTVLIALIALIVIATLWKFKKLQEPVVIALAAIAGLALYPLMH
jgi:chromate transporter